MRKVLAVSSLALALTLSSAGCAATDAQSKATDDSSAKAKAKKAERSSPKPTETSTPAQSSAPEELTVRAGDLIKDYNANREGADAVYQGHKLTVTGVVKTVGLRYVDLYEGSSDPFSTYVSAQVYLDDLTKLEAGQTVTIESSDLRWNFPVGEGGVIILDYARLVRP